QHITVRKAADGRAVLSQCRKSQLFYCPFCQPSIFKPRDYASVLTHIESHRLKAVLHREFTIFICHLECRAAKHFHCPHCPKTYVNRRDFTKHISQCELIHRPSCNPDDSHATENAPGSTVNAPGSTENAPGSTENAPGSTENAPGSTENAPGSTENAPGSTVNAPGSTENAPGSTENAPGSTVRASEALNVSSGTVKVPGDTGSTSLNPDEPNATVKCPVLECPAVRSAVKQKIKCPNCSLWLNKNNLRKHQQRKHVSTDKDSASHPTVRPAVKRKSAPCGQLRKRACTGQDTVVSLDPELMLQMDEPKRWRENPANTILDLMAPWLERLNSDQQFEVVRLLMGYVLELMDQFPGSSSSTSH
uniref:C2H2-type domain-containing protein n=1 Tax=Esox lucius TaxID=8010 RepID=A0AAY5KX90_ESOLU